MDRKVSFNKGLLRRGAWVAIALGILGASAGVTRYLIRNGPEARSVEPEERIVTVKVQRAVVSGLPLVLKSQGEVVPTRRTAVTAEVGGRVTVVHERFKRGESFQGPDGDRKGDLLLQIDRADYESSLAAAESALADARLGLTMEEVRKAQAMRDWLKISNGKEATELVRRVPQIASAKAKIVAAEASLEKAKRDLDRTEVRVPYDCRLERTYVDLGSTIAPGMPLVDLHSRGSVELRLPLSLEDYGYLNRKDGVVTGEVVAVGWIGGEKVIWNGRIIRSEEMVERATRSINVVAEFGVDGVEAPPVGMFVEASIGGKVLPSVVRVPHAAMINGDNILLAREGRLDIRPVKVVRTDASSVIVPGGTGDGEVPAGVAMVVTPPLSPVQNRRIMIETVREEERALRDDEMKADPERRE